MQLMRTGRTGKLDQEEATAVLELGITLGANIQGILQEREGGLEDEEEVDIEDGEDEMRGEWQEVEEVKLDDTLDDIPVSLDETVEDFSDALDLAEEDEEIESLIEPEENEGEMKPDPGSEERSLKWWRERVVALQKEADEANKQVDDQPEDYHEEEEEREGEKNDEEGGVDDEKNEGDEAHQSAVHSMIDTFINSVKNPDQDFCRKEVVSNNNGDDGKDEQVEKLPGKSITNEGSTSKRRLRKSLLKRKISNIAREEREGTPKHELSQEEVKPTTIKFDNPIFENSESSTNQKSFDEAKHASNSGVMQDGQSHASLESPNSVDKKANGGRFNCPLCLFIVAKKASLREHLSTAHYLSILLTKYCRQGMKHIFPDKNFIFTQPNNISGDLCCPFCEKMFSFKAELAKHLGTTHKKLKEITTIHSKVFVFKMDFFVGVRCTVPINVVGVHYQMEMLYTGVQCGQKWAGPSLDSFLWHL